MEDLIKDSVKNIMRTNLIVIRMEDNLTKALQTMEENGIRQLPVLNKKKLVGIITDRDLRRAQGSNIIDPETSENNQYWMDTVLVWEVMTKDVRIIGPHISIKEAALLLLNNKIGSLPVVDSGRLVGIVTQSDILGHLIERS